MHKKTEAGFTLISNEAKTLKDSSIDEEVIAAAIKVAWWQISLEYHETLNITVIENRVIKLLPNMPIAKIKKYRDLMQP